MREVTSIQLFLSLRTEPHNDPHFAAKIKVREWSCWQWIYSWDIVD